MKTLINTTALLLAAIINIATMAAPIDYNTIIDEAVELEVAHQGVDYLIGDIDSFTGNTEQCADSATLKTEVCVDADVIYVGFSPSEKYAFTRWDVVGYPEVYHNLPVNDGQEVINEAVFAALDAKDLNPTNCAEAVYEAGRNFQEDGLNTETALKVLTKMICE